MGKRRSGVDVSLGPGPVEPGTERGDIGGVDRRAAPDAKAGRRIAVVAEVVTRAFLLHERSEALRERRLRIGRKRRDRRIDDLEAHRRVGADFRLAREEVDPRGLRGPVGQHLGVGVDALDEGLCRVGVAGVDGCRCVRSR